MTNGVNWCASRDAIEVRYQTEEAEKCLSRGVELRVMSCRLVGSRLVDACGLSRLLPIYPTRARDAPALVICWAQSAAGSSC